jgi:hypothetical protein
MVTNGCPPFASNHMRRIRKEMSDYLAVSLICVIFARYPRFIVS